jgi:serine/threonine protein kinase
MSQPQSIKGYELRETLGVGGFGAVYRAYQPAIKREVAIKVIKPALANDPAFILRFEHEAQTVARLEHPHIVPLYDFWREPAGAYLVMRLMRGGSLHDWLNEQPLTLPDALRVLTEVAEALDAAHRGIQFRRTIHRDCWC